MTSDARLFRINPETQESEAVSEADFSDMGFRERRDIQEWIVANPSILGEELLVIGKEFSGFDKTNERADVIAVDQDGKLVVVELKRDDSGADVHWQAIKYASYFHHASPDDIIRMLTAYEKINDEESEERLKQHLDSDDLELLNHDQRVILASHRFAPQVTSAVLWLNEKASSEDFISCVQLTPFRDKHSNSTYIQASTIIPVPGTEEMVVGIGQRSNRVPRTPRIGGHKKRDEITSFLKGIAENTLRAIDSEIRPDKKSRWAGYSNNSDWRYYNLWYSNPPWGLGMMQYRLLLQQDESSSETTVTVRFTCNKPKQARKFNIDNEWLSQNDLEELRINIGSFNLSSLGSFEETDTYIRFNSIHQSEGLDEAFANEISLSLGNVIENVTPIINDITSAKNDDSESTTS